MTEHTPLPAEPPGAGVGFLSRQAALAFEPWLPHPRPYGALRGRRYRHARRLRGGRRRFRRVVLLFAVLFVLHVLLASAWVRWTLALLLLGLLGRRALWALRARRLRLPLPATNANIAELPHRTRAWLAHVRSELPPTAEHVIGRLIQRLDALAQQSDALAAPSEANDALRRLLAEELPELVSGYQRVPRTLTQTSSYQRPTPEHQLVEGLALLDAQLAQLHERLAEQDLNALATHLQYLRLKYDAEQTLSPMQPEYRTKDRDQA